MKPHVTMELSDEFILELTQAQQRLFGYIYRRVANRDQAMEVLQQVNLVLCHKADKALKNNVLSCSLTELNPRRP